MRAVPAHIHLGVRGSLFLGNISKVALELLFFRAQFSSLPSSYQKNNDIFDNYIRIAHGQEGALLGSDVIIMV